jgi:hypothetical protein
MTDSRGKVRLGCLLFLLLVAVAGYVGVLYIGSEFDFRSLRGEAQRQAGLAAQTTDQEILNILQRRARELDLPQQAERIEVRRLPGDQIRITGHYSDTLRFFNRWEWIRPRRINVQQAF